MYSFFRLLGDHTTNFKIRLQNTIHRMALWPCGPFVGSQSTTILTPGRPSENAHESAHTCSKAGGVLSLHQSSTEAPGWEKFSHGWLAPEADTLVWQGWLHWKLQRTQVTNHQAILYYTYNTIARLTNCHAALTYFYRERKNGNRKDLDRKWVYCMNEGNFVFATSEKCVRMSQWLEII